MVGHCWGVLDGVLRWYSVKIEHHTLPFNYKVWKRWKPYQELFNIIHKVTSRMVWRKKIEIYGILLLSVNLKSILQQRMECHSFYCQVCKGVSNSFKQSHGMLLFGASSCKINKVGGTSRLPIFGSRNTQLWVLSTRLNSRVRQWMLWIEVENLNEPKFMGESIAHPPCLKCLQERLRLRKRKEVERGGCLDIWKHADPICCCFKFWVDGENFATKRRPIC